MTKPTHFIYIVALFSLLCLSSCEKPMLSTDEESELPNKTWRIKFCINSFEKSIIPFENISFQKKTHLSRSTNIAQICTRISLVLFQDGKKVKTIHQKKSDTNFGNITVALPSGSYQFVAIAYSSQKTASIKKPEEIAFEGNKLSDTFYRYQEIMIGEDKTYNLEMKRAVAMFRLIITDEIPNNVKTMRFYYTGGSSTFNAITGYGCKKSRQTQELQVTEEQRKGNAKFEVYTFPHKQQGKLKIKVSALNAANEVVKECNLEDVLTEVNGVTQYQGKFFQNTSTTDANHFTFFTNDSWTQQNFTY